METVSEEMRDNAARLIRIQKDLKEALKEYPRESTGIKLIANKMDVSERTLRRIMKGTHTPNHGTILKIYRDLLGASTAQETILKAPKIFGDLVKREYDNYSLANKEAKFTAEIDHLLLSDSVFRSIYIETGTGTVTREKIGYMHGEVGLKVLDSMLAMDVICEISENVYSSSKNRANLHNETMQSLAMFLLQNHYNSEKSDVRGQNGISVYFEGLTPEAYNEILKIDWEAKDKKLKILKDPKSAGSIKAWSITVTDTLSKELIDHSANVAKEDLQ